MTLLFQIRAFIHPDDYESVYQLWANAGSGVHVGRSDSLGEISKKLQRDPDLFLVAENQAGIVGAVLGGFDGRRGLVYHLAVRREDRNAGIGRALMKELEDRLRSKGCLKCYLLVTYDNPEGRRFYQELGWERMELDIFGKDIG
ncbi:MAG TPA: GNAT family N-acetyltransferase [Anaerolineales bacterium]